MGRKMDALLRRSFRASKLKSTLSLALTRLSILKNHRQIRCSHTTSDVSQLLRLGHHHGALLRVDLLLRDRNMLDALLLIHSYITLLLDSIPLLQQHPSECPHELREAVCSLFFASSRIGEFPELQEIRSFLSSRYGRDLASHSIELRGNCPVNPTLVQKLSTRQPPQEVCVKVLEEIASENNIVLKLDEATTSTEQRPTHSDDSTKAELTGEARLTVEETVDDYGLPHSIKTTKKYKDVADAAQAAFESAAHAAEAARAAIVLSQSDARGSDDHGSPRNVQMRRSFKATKDDTSDSEHEQEAKNVSRSSQMDGKAVSTRLMSDSSTDPEEVVTEVRAMSFMEDPVKLLEKDTVIYDSEEETPRSTKATEDKDEGHHMVSSAKGPLGMHRAGVKGPVSVRTRHIRGY